MVGTSDDLVVAGGVVATQPTTVFLATSTVPVMVSGVVEAAEQAVIYAQTAGVLEQLPAREGVIVERGAVLAVQATPVANAELALRMAERDLSRLEQGLAVAMASGETQKAEVIAYSADEIARARLAAHDQRTSEVIAVLTATLRQAALGAVAAISYVDTHRSLFTAAGLSEYESVVQSLYGRMPEYFGNGIAAGRGEESLIAVYEQLSKEEPVAAVDLIAVSTVVGAKLQALMGVLQTAEAEVFDDLDAVEQARYLSIRADVIAALQTVLTAESTLQQVVDDVLEDVISQNQTVKVSAVDESLARVRNEYAGRLQAQATVVDSAVVGVAEAAQSLGVATAPFSGRVGLVYGSVGEYVTPGTPLLLLIGSGAREMVVTVPASLLPSLAIGAPFTIADEVVGTVGRVSAVATGGSGTVVIVLNESVAAGESLAGAVLVDAPEVYRVPRRYVFFDTKGPFITYADGSTARVHVVYDTGAELYVTASEVATQPLLPAVSISLE